MSGAGLFLVMIGWSPRGADARSTCCPERPDGDGWPVPVLRQEIDMDEKRMETRDVLMTPAEVARLFRVDPKTVTRWAEAGKLSSVRTLGGHRRYRRREVELLLRRQTSEIFE